MAASFIESLPNVGGGVLDKDNQKCCLCHEDYGTQPSTRGIIERPVQLPCSHILGSECITLWLTGQGNSCPLCRRIFFPREPEGEEEEEYSEDDHDDGGSTRYETLDVAEFNINDQEQYLQRRRATPSLNALPGFSGEVPDHAWRRSCERSLYKRLQARRHNIPRIGQDENSELEKRHLDLLFRDLEERGIFDELWGDSVGGDASGHELYLPSRRDMWNLMRDLGFGYGALFGPIQDEDSGWWSRNVWYPHDPSRGGFPWWMADRSLGGR